MYSLFKRCGFLSCWRSELYLGGDLGGAGRWQAGGGVGGECVHPGMAQTPGRVTRALFSLPTCLSLYSCGQAVRSVVMVLITEASAAVCGGLAHPPDQTAPSSLPGLAVCHLFSQSPLYWPVASCSQSDPNFPCEVFPRAHAHRSPPALLHTLS